MDKSEALEILKNQLKKLAEQPYAELLKLEGTSATSNVRGPSGELYQVEIEVNESGDGNLSLDGFVDDGNWSALSPLSSYILVGPNGEMKKLEEEI